jgi:hypothetical protein
MSGVTSLEGMTMGTEGSWSDAERPSHGRSSRNCGWPLVTACDRRLGHAEGPL